MNKIQTLIQEIGIDALNAIVYSNSKRLKHDPYMSTRSYAAGIECGMQSIISAINDAGVSISINKSKRKRKLNVKSRINIRNVAHLRMRRNTK